MKLIHDRNLTPVPYARITEPSRSLAQGMPWVHSADTNIGRRFAELRAQRQPAPNVKTLRKRGA